MEAGGDEWVDVLSTVIYARMRAARVAVLHVAIGIATSVSFQGPNSFRKLRNAKQCCMERRREPRHHQSDKYKGA
jgi:hypothetical protein